MNRGREGTREYMGFDLYIPSKEFVNQTESDTAGRAASKTDAVISLRDLGKIYWDRKAEVEVCPLPNEELFGILRNARDNRGEQVYKGAEFGFEDVNLNRVFGVQSYINMKNTYSMQKLNKFMEGVGMNAASPFVVSYMGEEKYTSIYSPPLLVFYINKGFEQPLNNIRDIIKNNGKITINSFGEERELNLPFLLDKAERFISEHSDAVPIIKDGTHRAYISYLAGAKLKAVTVRNGVELFTSMPFAFEDMVPTSEKPDELKTRYPGIVDFRVLLSNLGIDP